MCFSLGLIFFYCVCFKRGSLCFRDRHPCLLDNSCPMVTQDNIKKNPNVNDIKTLRLYLERLNMFSMRIQLTCKIGVPFAEKGQQNSGQEAT